MHKANGRRDERSAPPRLRVDLTAPPPIPDAAVLRAAELLREGDLFRYGEASGRASEVAAFETEFAGLLGRQFAVATNSCGSALFLALRSAGLRVGDSVLMNAFTLAPVAGAVEHAGGSVELVDVTDECVIDTEDLARKAQGPATILLLSHMRGHISDMDVVGDICRTHGLRLVEDCAHALGATWSDRPIGTFGDAAAFSAQSFKHLNSGEGGVLVTDDADIAARAILASGSYMLYEQHAARPPASTFTKYLHSEPNCSLRMSELAAAILRPQLELLPERIARWNRLYQRMADRLEELPHVAVVRRHPKEGYVGSSIQFYVRDLTYPQLAHVMMLCDSRGLHVKWFGRKEAEGFTSSPAHWSATSAAGVPPHASLVLASLCDLRIPLSMGRGDCDAAALILGWAIHEASTIGPAAQDDKPREGIR